MALRLITNLCDGGTGCCDCDCERVTSIPGGCDGCKYTVTVDISGSYAYVAEDYECGLKYLNQYGYIQKTGDLIFSPNGSLELIQNCAGTYSYRDEDCNPDGGSAYCCCQAEDCSPQNECYRHIFMSGTCGQEPSCSFTTEGSPPFQVKVDTFLESPKDCSFIISGRLEANKQIVITGVDIDLGFPPLGFEGPSDYGTYPVTIQFPEGSPVESQTVNLYSTSYNLPGEVKNLSASIIIS